MSQYIVQYMTKYLNIQHFNKDDDDFTKYYDKTIIHPEFSQLYDYPYCIVVAEPGYGKTRLLKEIVLRASEYQKKAFFIDSKKIDNDIVTVIKKCKQINPDWRESEIQNEWLFANTEEDVLDETTIICLDALDELPFSKLYGFFEMIESFIQEYPKVKLFISCRIHHLQKIDFNLQTLPFEYIELSNFGNAQISTYLKNNIDDHETIDGKIQSNGLMEFLATPRYLYYFVALIKDKPIDEVLRLTRIELFENFIYRKLDKERDKAIPRSQYDLIKRVLEKIALIMKMYQVSQISKDELMTLFDRMDSAFSHIIFRDDLLAILYDRSVLKDNIDSIEFENKMFLDFLAAKELLRFHNIEQVFFDLAFEPYLMEIYTEWFYVIPFLFEQNEQLLTQIVDYLAKNKHKILRDEYFEALTSIEPKLIKPEMRTRIFYLVFDYYTDHNKWFLSIGHYTLSKKLAQFCDSDILHQKLISSVDDRKNNEQLYVTRVNAVEIFAEKKIYFKEEQIEYWKNKFSEWLYLKPLENYQTLHRHIIAEASTFAHNDFDWIKKHRFIFEEGIELQHEYAGACFEIAPEDTFSIDTYFEAHDYYEKNKLDKSLMGGESIRYIFKLKTSDGVAYSLKRLTEEDGKKYLRRFLHESNFSSWERYHQEFVSHIKNGLNQKIVEHLQNLVLLLIGDDHYRYSGKKDLLSSCLNLLIENDKEYLFTLLEKLYEQYQNKEIYIWEINDLIIGSLSKYLYVEVIEEFYQNIKLFDEQNYSYKDILYNLYITDFIDESIKQFIFSKYEIFILERQNERQKYFDEMQAKSIPNKSVCEKWIDKIEPEVNKFDANLFRFYMQEKNELINCKNYMANRQATIDWAKAVLKNNNPLKNGKVEKTGDSSHTIWYLPYFSDCVELLLKENEPLNQEEVDNAFRYLPFDINSGYENTLKLAKKPSEEAIQDVIDVYSGTRKDDLANYGLQNFVEFYKHFHLKEAEPLLLNMVENTEIADFIRTEIIDILPIDVLTKDKIDELLKSDAKTKKICEKFLAILVQKHHDEKALIKVIKVIKATAQKTQVKKDEGSLFGTGLEFTNHPLALVLMNYHQYRVDIDEELLLLAVQLRNKNKKANAYFLEEIVFGHIKLLRNDNSFEPLHLLEKFLQKNHEKTALHWFEYKFIELKSLYLEKMAKPSHIMDVLKQYQSLQEKEYLIVPTSRHLLEILKEIIEKDLKSWIENEGAYKYINELAQKKENRNAEDFIQKTIKSQIELALLKRSFRPSDLRIKREEQLLDDKRTDFTVSYGLVGQILIELKLDNNTDAKVTHKEGREYSKTLHQYIKGTNSDFGIFLIFNVDSEQPKFEKQMQGLIQHYSAEDSICVMGMNCRI